MVWNSLDSNCLESDLRIITLAIQYIESLPVPNECVLAGLRCERDGLLEQLRVVYDKAQED